MKQNYKSRFSEISPDECLRCYPFVLSNADSHYKSALLLAKNGHYGNAIALLILSAEESLKALVLYLEGKGFEIRKIKNVNKVFHQHVTRHGLINDFLIIPQVVLFALKGFKHRQVPNLFEIATAGLEIVDVVKGEHWWTKADLLKQKGFYTDYKESLVIPQALTEQDYRQTLRYIESCRDTILEIIQYIDKVQMKDWDRFKETIRQSELYKLIEERLQQQKSA